MSWSNEAVLAEAVEKCCDINSLAVINEEQLSQLMVACYHGNPDYVQDLLSVPEIKIDLQNDKGRHALMCASEMGHCELVQLILGASSKLPPKLVNLPDSSGTTALMLASKGNYTDIVLILLQNGAIVDMQDSNGRSALMLASMNGGVSTVSVLILNGANVNLEAPDGFSSLMAASKYGHHAIASMLIQKGAYISTDFDEEDSRNEENKYELNYANIIYCVDQFFKSDPAAMVAAASASDATFIKEFLTRHPNKVNERAENRAAIHVAALTGVMEVAKIILEFKPDLEIEDRNGNKPLHYSAFRDNDKVAELLIDAGANVNSKNEQQVTALITAAVMGHTKVLKTLAHCPDIQLASQDKFGDTALHKAVLGQKSESVSTLLEVNADPTILNSSSANCIHLAAIIGFLPAMEQFILKFPAHISVKKDSGYNALHLAVANNHPAVLTALVNSEVCNIDEPTNTLSTALHIAVRRGHSECVETLIGLGSNPNVQDVDGNTPLHTAVRKVAADDITSKTPELKKVKDSLTHPMHNIAESVATIVCFLVQEGASIDIQNNKGQTPLQLCTPAMAAVITTLAESDIKNFHGSLRTAEKPVLCTHTSESNSKEEEVLTVEVSAEVKEPFQASLSEDNASPPDSVVIEDRGDLPKHFESLLLNLKKYMLYKSSHRHKDDMFFKYHCGRVLKVIFKLHEDNNFPSIVTKCYDQIRQVLPIMKEMALKKLSDSFLHEGEEEFLMGLAPLSTLPLILFFFFQLANSGFYTILEETGVISYVSDALISLNQLTSWNKDASWLLRMSLATLFEVFKFSEDFSYGKNLSDVFSHLCVHEDIELSLPARLLYSMSPVATRQSKLLEITELEATFLVQSLKLYAFPEDKWSQFKWVKGQPYVSVNLKLDFLFLKNLFQMNSANCLRFTAAKPLEILIEMLLVDNAQVHDKTVELIYSCIVYSGEHKEMMLQFFDPILKIANIAENFEDVCPKHPVHDEEVFVVCEKALNEAIYTMRYIMSVKEEDLPANLAEILVKRSCEINYLPFAEKDFLCRKLVPPITFADDPKGRAILMSYLQDSSLPIMKIFCAFTRKCLLKIFLFELEKENIIPVTSLLRLERVLIFLYSFCQYSAEFCRHIADSDFVHCFQFMLEVYSRINSHDDLSEVTRRLPELLLFLLSTCAVADAKCEGYFNTPNSRDMIKSYCSELYPSTTRMLAKCVMSSLARFQSISEKEYELTDSELEFLQVMLSVAAKDADGDCSAWHVYTLTTAHYLHFLLQLLCRLAHSEHNSKLIAESINKVNEKTTFDIMNLVFEFHTEECVLKYALLFLETMIRKLKLQTVSSQLISAVKQLIFSSSSTDVQEGAYFCILALDLQEEVAYDAGIPHSLLDFQANFRLENYSRCIDILKAKLKSVVTSEEKAMLMKFLGISSFHIYRCKRNAGETLAVCLDYAKQAVSCLGAAYDSHCINGDGPEAEMLDIAMSDFIANQVKPELKLKPLIRCLLCRKKCQKGEKIIKSHIWPNSCLKSFTHSSSNVPGSMKIFDSTLMEYGTLLSPGQISYPMLCQQCENHISKFENLFKSNFFDVVYPKMIAGNNPEETFIALDSDWLFLFCVSIMFRFIGVAMNSYSRYIGNVKEIHQLMVNCRKVLTNQDCAEVLAKLKIAVFLTPIQELLSSGSNVSPAFKSIIFSKCMGAHSKFALGSGDQLNGNVEFLWCSIGTINIVAGITEKSFNLVSLVSTLTSSQRQFIVPSSLQQYLLFPSGLLREFERLASKYSSRVLNASKAPSSKTQWMFEQTSSFEEYSRSEIASLKLEGDVKKEEHDVINYLPKPFDSLRQTVNVKEISPAKVIIHSTSMTEDASVVTSVFVLTVLSDEIGACALLRILSPNFIVWVVYSLSVNDFSIQSLIKCKNMKLLKEIEKKFDTRSITVKELKSALLRTGFSSMAHLAEWIHINWIAMDKPMILDMKCSGRLRFYCDYCGQGLGLCNMCMMPATSKLTQQGEIFAQVCASTCGSYYTAEDAMVLEIDVQKDGTRLLTLSSNAIAFGITDPKGKVIVHIIKSANRTLVTVLCSIRYSNQQKIIQFDMTKDDFEPVLDNNSKTVQELPISRLLSVLIDFKEKL